MRGGSYRGAHLWLASSARQRLALLFYQCRAASAPSLKSALFNFRGSLVLYMNKTHLLHQSDDAGVQYARKAITYESGNEAMDISSPFENVTEYHLAYSTRAFLFISECAVWFYPFRAGSIVTLLGVALLYRSIAGVVVVFAACLMCSGRRIRVEENALKRQFRHEFEQYCDQTKYRLIPLLY